MPIDTNVTALNLDDYKYGFKDPDKYVFKSEKGLSKKVVEMISAHEGRAGVDAQVPAEGARDLREEAGPHVGRGPLGPRTWTRSTST